MNKEQLEKEAIKYDAEHLRMGRTRWYHNVTIKEAYLAGAEPREKQITELEEKISVLLSCKNCTENKGGYICKKEYENKCLAQKIQFIKELQEENAELKEQVSYLKDNLRVARKDREDLQLDVAKGLKEFVTDYPATALRYLANEKYVERFNEAKTHIHRLLVLLTEGKRSYAIIDEARAFIKE